jgi:hypothetical protein
MPCDEAFSACGKAFEGGSVHQAIEVGLVLAAELEFALVIECQEVLTVAMGA